jgi:hypothetical protein
MKLLGFLQELLINTIRLERAWIADPTDAARDRR